MTVETPSIKQQAIRLISKIQSEDIRRQRENRENNRQNISLPVTINSIVDNQQVDGVSRDFSSEGIGLITTEPIDANTICDLQIQMAMSFDTISAKCCWCKPYGNSFFLTGWKFISLT